MSRSSREYLRPVPVEVAAEPASRTFQSVALLAARIIVGGIFLIAAIDKLPHPAQFADAVRAFHLLPGSLVLPFAYIVPWLELLVGAYLVFGFLTRIGAVGAIVLLGAFVIALLDSLFTGNTNHACGCFGSLKGASAFIGFLAGGTTVTWWDPIRDLILIGLSIFIAWRGAGPYSIDALLNRGKR